MNSAIDTNDLQYIQERFGEVVGWLPGAVTKANGKINPQATMAMLADGHWCTVFHVKPVYYETYTGAWRPLSEVTTHHGNKKITLNENWWQIHPRYLNWLDKRCKLIGGELLIPSFINTIPTPYAGVVRSIHESFIPLHIGLTTTTVYPDPNPETTTVDGLTWDTTSTTSWATMIGAAGDLADDSTGSAALRLFAYWTDGSNYRQNGRTIVLFDTSSVPDTDTIDSAVLSMYVIDKTDPASKTPNSDVYTSTPASNTAIATTDYAQTGSTSQTGSPVAYSSMTASAYSDFTFNATGRGNVSKTGVSKFSVKNANYDAAATAPGLTSADAYCRVNSADTAGTTTDPKLVVVHSAGSSFSAYPMMHMMAVTGGIM